MFNSISSLNIWIKFSLILAILIAASFGWWALSPLILEPETLHEDVARADGDILLYNGTFVGVGHRGSGLVEIVETAEGKTQLVFINVDIEPGPDISVYLAKKASFSGIRDSKGSAKKLGDLPAPKGNFSMDIIGVTNLDEFQSVLVYCEPFSVIFAYATLSAASK